MKIIIAPDKFKGSLTAFEFCDIVEKNIKAINNSIDVISLPMADGGDGFAEVLKHYLQTETIICHTQDPLGRSITANYQFDKNTRTAVIEMAVASGLVLLKEQERNPSNTSTYGTGTMMVHAIKYGAEHIVLGLGGSATNDAGAGILAALGFRFYDGKGKVINPCGGNLMDIETIKIPAILQSIRITIACDVTNPLFGENGAAFVFAPQKGADTKMVRQLDTGLQHMAQVYEKYSKNDISSMAGIGAAGGAAAGLLSFYDATLKSGIDIVMKASAIHHHIENADMIITGEGKIDDQTLDGKVIGAITKLGRLKNIPVVAFCGRCELIKDKILKLGLHDVVPIAPLSMPIKDAMKMGREILAETVKKYFINFLE